ncbi:hypothetical protein AsGV008 [Agrotis segetum granulovirus]|uniref:Uncharacterized protein n=1 Tax=Agrotis segetum granulosis virus TaxID=10464 RepID=A0A0H4BKS9_GVAS|nr:hypothetical protein AsGV008 [Agrotis segetum granulovirus]AKN63281.1 hypothetical protein AsGV008 [Agrotis segetum granulovirus]
MDSIAVPKYFNFQDQQEWNRLKDLCLYVQNIPDINASFLDTLNALIEGFVLILNENTKDIVLECIKDLLEKTKERHVDFDSRDTFSE